MKEKCYNLITKIKNKKKEGMEQKMNLKKLSIVIITTVILFSTTTVFAENLNTELTTNKKEIQAS